ncbi:MAG: BMP family ABC transporter substrate-binding protein [Promethearchaeota archaeon]|jgi:basic membrane lipoprotein Med (substrate-binding protein (PBP1-ABC) superfamily)
MKLKMNRKWRFSTIVLTAIVLVSMVPNTTVIISNDAVQTEAPILSTSHKKAALMIGGDETDLGFSWVAIQGMYELRDKYNWSISISRQVAFPDQYKVANDYGAAGYDVVFMVGGQFIETSYFSGLPDKYNQTVWVQIPGLNFSLAQNLVGLHPNFQTEGHYLAGVLSGLMTETDNVGVVFGEWYEYLSMEFYAFKAGFESVNSDGCVHGVVAGTWGDAALGKQITKALIETKNVDIRGVIAACVEAGIAVIGTVGDQYSLAPLNTMTSIGMNTSMVMDYVVSNLENGTPWNLYYASLNMTAVGGFLYPYHHYDEIIPQSVKDQVENAKAGIANGTIEVPEIWYDDDGPVAPTDCPTEAAPPIPGFPLLYIGLATTTMLGIMIILVNRSRRIVNKHKS